MGIVLDDATVLVVMTEKDGCRDIYGHVLFANVKDANRAKEEAESEGSFDSVWVSRWDVL